MAAGVAAVHALATASATAAAAACGRRECDKCNSGVRVRRCWKILIESSCRGLRRSLATALDMGAAWLSPSVCSGG